MELYEFSEDRKKILVYELQGIKEEIKKYKEEHLRRRFYDLETVNKGLINRLVAGGKIAEWRLRCKNKDLYANLITDSNEASYERMVRDYLLEKYYDSDCLTSNITKVYRTNDKLDEFCVYSLLPLDIYEKLDSYTDDVSWYRFPNLLVLQNDLVGLHFLEQGDCESIARDDIISRETPFYLFDLTLKDKYNCSVGILDLSVMKEAKENIEYSSKVLTLYRNSLKK